MMIRGKIISGKKITPREVVVGDPLFIERDNRWYRRDGTEVELSFQSLDKLFQDLDISHSYDDERQ